MTPDMTIVVFIANNIILILDLMIYDLQFLIHRV